MLGVRKPYKTKLCILYQRGRCPRPDCNFAHGDAELRRFSGGSTFNGRRDYRNADLRDKLDRRNSPHRRYSPGRDARNYHSFHGRKSTSHDRGVSRSTSPVKRGERRHRKKQHTDGQTDDSGSFRTSDGAEERKREDKVSSYVEKDVSGQQLKQLHSDIERLEDHKSQLEIFLEEKVDEAHKLSKRNADLEDQLNKEEEDCKRITSKIKKFVRAHGRYLKAQEELKRSQARFERLGNQLGSDILKSGPNEEDSSVNILSDVELNAGNRRSPRNDEMRNNATPIKKRTHVLSATSEEVKAGNSHKKGRFSGIFSKSEKHIRSEGPTIHSETDKEAEPVKAVQNKKDVHKSFMDDYKIKQGKVGYDNINSSDKVKSSEVGRSLPSTSIAAHAVDELIEAIELEERSEPIELSAVNENGASDNKITLPLPPPPVDPTSAYKEYEGEDEDVDVEIMDSEALDIDLNAEVEIEDI